MKDQSKSILFKQYLAELIDICICIIPAILVYYFTNLKDEIESLNIRYLLSAIYLFYGILSTFFETGQTVGDKIMNILLINTKNGKPSRLGSLIRIIYKAYILFVIADIENVSLIMYSFILIIFPFKFKKSNYTYYSLLSLGTNSIYIKKRNVFKK
ncbi:RDD family protein [Calditrichota bacterium LG25]